MSDASNQERPTGLSLLLQRAEAAINGMTMALNVIGTLLIVVLMVLINADVFGRTLFASPISGVPEIVSLSIVAIVFLQIAQAVKMGRLTRTDALLNALDRRLPRARAGLELLYNLAAIYVISALLWASYPFFIKSWVRDTFVGTIGDFIAPVWPVKLVILIGCSALILQFLFAALRAASALFSRTRAPDEAAK